MILAEFRFKLSLLQRIIQPILSIKRTPAFSSIAANAAGENKYKQEVI